MDFTPLSRTYGELEYKIDPSFFEKNRNSKINTFMFVEIKGNKDSTFVFESFSDNSNMTHLISELNRYATIDKKSTDYYFIKLVEMKSNVNDKNK